MKGLNDQLRFPQTPAEDWDDAVEDSPYCMCDEQPMEEEEAFNVCSACGKPLS